MNSRKNTLKWLWEVSGRDKLRILLLIILHSLNGFSGVLYALFLRSIVDSAVQKNTDAFILNVIFIVSLVAFQIAARAVIRYCEEASRSCIENRFKERLFSYILKKDYAAVSAVHSGEWMNRLTSDCVVVASNMTEIVPGLSDMAVKMISALIMIAIMDIRFVAVLVPMGLACGAFAYFLRKKLKMLHKTIQQKDGKLRVYMQERLASLMMIRSFAAEETVMDGMREKASDHRSARMDRIRFSNICSLGMNAAMQGMYLAGVCYCGYGILSGAITYGTMTAVTQLISQIQTPFANLTNYLPRYYALTASAERLMEAETFSDDSDKPVRGIGDILNFYGGELESFGADSLCFTYYPASDEVGEQSKENMPTVLTDISFEIKKGEYVAFTGHSGCGKSTVIKLLMKVFTPDSGQVYYTAAGGEKHSLTTDMRRLFAYVPQGNNLMNGSIRDIVSFADSAARTDDARIRRALEIACAWEFVSGLENGTDTMLGERGTGLSEGQTQRIAVARAIFSDSPVLLLDEATSALDNRTEEQLLKNLRSMTDKTVIIVTHRPAALEICDKELSFTEQGAEMKKLPRREI